jgi:hypothetical protein
VKELEVVAPGLWIRPLRLLVGDARLLKPSDMQTNRSHPVMGALIIRLHRQNLFQRSNGVRMLEILRRTPQDKCSRGMSLWEHRVQHQGCAAMVFRHFQPSMLRVEFGAHLHADK